jgi:hypothetical protein
MGLFVIGAETSILSQVVHIPFNLILFGSLEEWLGWLTAIDLVEPLLTLLAVCAAIIISSRVTEQRVAEQLSAPVILTLILIIVGQSAGLSILDRQMIMLIGVIVLIIEAYLFIWLGDCLKVRRF